ncbi:ABC transporter permease [Treponema primitia]|uniref:ABC transporter permease n=1 Tax=Treponema primitia TaxID=88058 RepID=UPI0002554C57|nr:ABC transporter permease [Treponema primitia]
MAGYFIKRILLALATLLLVICLTFILMNTVPGGPFLGEKAISARVLAELEAKYGLDKPLPVQLKNYVLGLLRGDMGVSLKMQKNRPVRIIIGEMFPVSAKIGAIALLWATIVGISLGCLAAYTRGRWEDSLLQVVTTLGVAFPVFVSATALLVLFAGGVFHVFPSSGISRGPISYVLPCFTLGLTPMCSIARYTRSSMLDVLNKEYIKTVRAYGHPVSHLIFKHALRNALIPVVTYMGPLIAAVLTGTFVVESVFNIPGLGRYFIQSIQNRDYPLIMGTTIFFAALVILMSVLVDLIYKIIDPRIQFSNEAG